MKRPSWRILIFLIYILNTAKASTSLRFYDDTDCQDTHSVLVTGPENGLCTPINAPYGYGSYKLDNISAGYGVTVYGARNLNCGNGYKFSLQFGQCYNNDTSVNQFTIDQNTGGLNNSSQTTLQTSSTSEVSTSNSSPSSTTSNGSMSASMTASSAAFNPAETSAVPSPPNNSSGLNTETIVGIAVGVPAAIVAVCTMLKYLLDLTRRRHRHRKRLVDLPESSEGRNRIPAHGGLSSVAGAQMPAPQPTEVQTTLAPIQSSPATST